MVIIWFGVWVLISDFGLQNVIGVFDLVFWVLCAICSVVGVRVAVFLVFWLCWFWFGDFVVFNCVVIYCCFELGLCLRCFAVSCG